MKKLVLLIILLGSFVSFSQENLSEKEKAKRQKNLDAVNPFHKFGYKAKVATLSKGKYLEMFISDSIVQIGSFHYNILSNKVTGFTQLDTLYSEATLRPEVVSRWINPDPLSDEFPDKSPYNFVNNNPIYFIDPTGLAPMSPIYGTDGEFLGTDNQGLTGKAIVMDAENFEQGMSHDDALSNNLGVDGLESTEAGSQLLSHYDGLKDRPDYDGIVTPTEASDWFRNGDGGDLFIDVSKIDFKASALSADDLSTSGTQEVTFFNLYNNQKDNPNSVYRPSTNPTLSYVFGTLRMNLINAKTGEVSLQNDAQYGGGFDGFNFTNPILRRIYGLGGNGTDFNFKGYGTGTVNLHFNKNLKSPTIKPMP